MTQVDITRRLDKPTILFEQGGHAVYWLGINEPSAYRTNVYLIRDEDKAFLVDPGHPLAGQPEVRHGFDLSGTFLKP